MEHDPGTRDAVDRRVDALGRELDDPLAVERRAIRVQPDRVVGSRPREHDPTGLLVEPQHATERAEHGFGDGQVVVRRAAHGHCPPSTRPSHPP